MRKVTFLSIIAGLIIYGCSSGNKRDAGETIAKDSIPSERADSDLIVFPSDSGTVHLDLIDGKEELTIHKEKNQSIYAIFESDGYKRISAQLSSPDSLANIRFSQIIMPDGKMDGPFARELDYELPVDGSYKIIINENMMAGDPWDGNFTIKVKLTK